MENNLPTVRELFVEKIPDLQWIIPGFLPEGLSLIAAKPKSGKSFMVLNICTALSTGGVLFDKYQCKKTRVLYISLEDSKRRIRSRLTTIFNSLDISSKPELFHYLTHFPQLEHGGLEKLIEILSGNNKFGLIAIDTMSKFMPPKDNAKDSYIENYRIMGKLHDLTKRNPISILLIHHLRKNSESDSPFDLILGSTAIPASADSMYVIKKSSTGTYLHCTGRDLEPMELPIEFDGETGLWRMNNLSTIQVSEQRQKILEILSPEKILSPKEISDEGKLSHGSCKVLLGKMLKDEVLKQPEPGKYQIK